MTAGGRTCRPCGSKRALMTPPHLQDSRQSVPDLARRPHRPRGRPPQRRRVPAVDLHSLPRPRSDFEPTPRRPRQRGDAGWLLPSCHDYKPFPTMPAGDATPAAFSRKVPRTAGVASSSSAPSGEQEAAPGPRMEARFGGPVGHSPRHPGGAGTDACTWRRRISPSDARLWTICAASLNPRTGHPYLDPPAPGA
jgi:hypothetical protein